MIFKGFIVFSLILLILTIVFSNLLMFQAEKQNKVKKASAISYMTISIFSGIAISSFLIWKFFIS